MHGGAHSTFWNFTEIGERGRIAAGDRPPVAGYAYACASLGRQPAEAFGDSAMAAASRRFAR